MRFERLESLAGTYRAQGLMYGVVDCADEVLELYLLHGNRQGSARMLRHLGAVMLEVGRPDSAANYLVRAEKDLTDPPKPPSSVPVRW